MTLAQLSRQVSDKTGLSDATGSADLAFIWRALNEGVRQVLQDTHCYVAETTISIVAGTDEYTLATSILQILEFDNPAAEPYNFVIAPASEVLARRRSGAPTGTPTRFTLMGSNFLVVTPTPATSYSLGLYYVPLPTEMSADAHDASSATYGGIPTFAHKALEYYACAEGMERNKDPDFTNYYLQKYQAEIVKIKKRLRGLAGRHLPPPIVGYPGHRTYGRRNDADYGYWGD